MNKLFTVLLIGLIPFKLFADWGFWDSDRSWIVFQERATTATYSIWNNGVGTFNNKDFGTFVTGETFQLAAYDIKTFKNNGSDVTGGKFFYTIYLKGNRPGTPVFNPTTFGFIADLGSGNQKWGCLNMNINLLNNLSPGEYTIEVYSETSGKIPDETKYDNNSGTNFVGHFRYNYTRTIADGNWSTSTNWINSVSPSNTISAEVAHTIAVDGAYSCYDLKILTGKTLTVSATSSLTVNGTLTNNAGNAGLVIKSDASGTGSLITNSSVSATAERYITGSTDLTSNKYHFVCRPFTENYTSGEWLDSYLFEHNEAATTEATAWTAIGSSTSYPLTASKGYLLYYPEAAKTYSHTGTLKNDNTTVSAAYTSGALYAGYNLIANMYSSALDFSNASYWSGCDPTIWIWNSAGGNYGSYVRSTGGTNNATKDIPVGQGFFVKVASAGTLTIDKAARVHSNQAYLKNSVVEQNKLRLKVDANTYFDEILMSFNNDATTEYDSEFDAKKMIGQEEAPQLSSIATDGTQLSINSLPFADGDVLIPLKFSLTHAAEVTFNATGVESFNPNATLYFEDTEMGQVINLREQPFYIINYGGGAAENRFWLRIGSLTVNQKENQQINGTVFASNGKIKVDIPAMQNKNVTINVFNSIGQLVSSTKQFLTGIAQVSAPSQSGVYIVKVGCNELSFTQKIIIK